MNSVRIKSLVLGLLLLRIVLVSSAQERIDLPYYYCAMNGSVLTNLLMEKSDLRMRSFLSRKQKTVLLCFKKCIQIV